MMKNLNEQLNIDLKNGTWSTSTSDDSSNGGSNSGEGSNSGGGSDSGEESNSGGGSSSTNPKSPDYYNDYQTNEVISGTGKNINNNNTGDYSDYATDEKVGNTTTKVNDYSDYSDAEENNGADSTKSKTTQPMTFSTYYDEEPVTSKTPPVSGQPLDTELTPQQKYSFNR
jgi:hypothetical protein